MFTETIARVMQGYRIRKLWYIGLRGALGSLHVRFALGLLTIFHHDLGSIDVTLTLQPHCKPNTGGKCAKTIPTC